MTATGQFTVDRHAVRLVFEIKNTQPIELVDLTQSLLSVAALYERHAADDATVGAEQVKLYVTEIRSGSIIAELMALTMTMPLPQIFDGVGSLVKFAHTLKSLLDALTSGAKPPETVQSARDLRDVNQLLGPVAKDGGAQLNIVARDHAQVFVNLSVDSNAANAAQNRIANMIAMDRHPVAGLHEKQLFFWFQARDQSRATTGDKGIIEAISPRPVKVLISSDALKEQMLSDALFTKGYIVDVEVQTMQGRPGVYKILAVHGAVDRPE